MNRKMKMFTSAAAAIVGVALSASAAPTVTLSLTATDTGGNTLPTNASGQYIVNSQDEQIWVTVNATVTNPFTLASNRATAVKGKGLGVSTITTNLVSVAPNSPAGSLGDASTSGDMSPVIDGHSGVTAQQAYGTSYLDDTPDADGFAFVNLNDLGGDGDLDVNGTGYGIPQNSLPTTAGTLAKYQYGVAGSANGDTVALVSHLYTANNIPLTGVTINTNTLSLNVFDDTGASSLTAFNDISGVIEGSATFVSVPEPASLSLLGLGALGLVARRRRA